MVPENSYLYSEFYRYAGTLFMSKLNRIFCLLGLSLLPAASQAQVRSSDSGMVHKSTPVPAYKKPKPFTLEKSVGFRLNTDGWSAVYETGKSLSEDQKRIERFYDVRVWQFEFSERRHPKELRMVGWDQNQQSDKQYVFGKVNNFYALKINYLYRKMIAGKPDHSAVSMHMVFGGGLAIGLVKPYYVDAYVGSGSGSAVERKQVKYSPEVSEYFLNPLYVVGAASWMQGIGETKIAPGLHAKVGSHFDFANRTNKVLAIEVGATAEFYSRKIEMMAVQKPQSLFFNLYAGFQFGSRRRGS